MDKSLLNTSEISALKKTVYNHYRSFGRSLPWRGRVTPYEILVSEIMLQQTQVPRVLPKYKEFIKNFPDFSTLATAPLSTILKTWQGLGYNRRAIFLKKLAEKVTQDYKGKLPKDFETLKKLPGVGSATAAAVCVYAYRQPHVFIETNVRTVFIHHFFKDKESINDKQLLPLVKQALDKKNPREWYWALMDYGSYIKQTNPNPNRRSKNYTKQSPFLTSNRRIRGLILKSLVKRSPKTAIRLVSELQIDKQIINKNIIQLEKEGFIKKQGSRILLA